MLHLFRNMSADSYRLASTSKSAVLCFDKLTGLFWSSVNAAAKDFPPEVWILIKRFNTWEEVVAWCDIEENIT